MTQLYRRSKFRWVNETAIEDVLREPVVPSPLSVVRPPPPAGPGLLIVLDKHVLHALVDRVLPTVSSRNVLPALRHLHLSTSQDVLQIRAASLDRTFLTSTTLVDIQRPGSILLPATRLAEILKNAREGQLTLSVLHGTAQISVGSASWKLRTYPEQQFPPTPEWTSLSWHDIDRLALLRAISTVRYAAAKGDQIALMSLSLADGRLTACDGMRFHQVTIESSTDIPPLRLPLGVVDDVVRLLNSAAAPVVLAAQTQRHVILRLGVDLLALHQQTGHYPNMEQQLLRPALENKHALTVHRADLLAAIRRVRVNASAATRALRLNLLPDALALSTSDREGNSAEEMLDAAWSSAPRQLVVHHDHLLELLSAQTSEDVVFWLGTDTATRRAPLLVRTTESSGTDGPVAAVAVLQQMLDVRS